MSFNEAEQSNSRSPSRINIVSTLTLCRRERVRILYNVMLKTKRSKKNIDVHDAAIPGFKHTNVGMKGEKEKTCFYLLL